MKLLFTLFKIIVINLLVIVGLLLVTMLPRETNQVELNEFKVKYIFSVQAYFTNISEFIKDRASTLSWGETWSSQTSVFQEMIHYFAKSSLVLLFSLLIALVLGFGIGMIIHAFGRKLKRGGYTYWLKVPDFLLYIPLISFVYSIGKLNNWLYIAAIVSVYPTTYLIRIACKVIKERGSLPVKVKSYIGQVFVKLTTLTLRAIGCLFFVEWLTGFEGLGFRLIELVDFSTEKFPRAFRGYEYELILGLLCCILLIVFIAHWIEFVAKRKLQNTEKHWGVLLFAQIFILICACLLVLFPRAGIQDYTDITYIFSVDSYKENISGLVNGLMDEHTLGKTKTGFLVEDEIKRYFPRSVKIIFTAFVLSVCLGLIKGFFDFKYQNRWFSFIGRGTTWLTSSTPDFFLIILLQWFIILYFQSIDVFGYEEWYNFILPSLLVSIHPAMYIANITRAAFLDESGEHYVQVAFSKGFTRNYVMVRHILKNCIGTICNHLPSLMLYIMSNLLIIEWLLDYKGAAYRLFKAIDYTKTVSVIGGLGTEEGSMIFGILVCFMFPLFLAQVISSVTKHNFTKAGRE